MNYKNLTVAVVLTLTLPIVLAYLYTILPIAAWLAAATINSVIAVLLLIFYRRILSQELTNNNFRFYIPSLAVLIICILAILVSSFYLTPIRGKISNHQYLWILWIPVVEEIVFRLGIGRQLRGLTGNLVGGYCSAVCFSLAHAIPTIDKVVAGKVGIFLGPFLLGLVCEYLYVKGKNLLPCITFHAACNASVPIFVYFDQRWLSWLSVFFQTGTQR